MAATQFTALEPQYLWLSRNIQPTNKRTPPECLKPFLFDFLNSKETTQPLESTKYSTQGTKKLMVTCRKTHQEFTSFLNAAKTKQGWADFWLQVGEVKKFLLLASGESSWEHAVPFVCLTSSCLGPAGLAQPISCSARKVRKGEMGRFHSEMPSSQSQFCFYLKR